MRLARNDGNKKPAAASVNDPLIPGPHWHEFPEDWETGPYHPLLKKTWRRWLKYESSVLDHMIPKEGKKIIKCPPSLPWRAPKEILEGDLHTACLHYCPENLGRGLKGKHPATAMHSDGSGLLSICWDWVRLCLTDDVHWRLIFINASPICYPYHESETSIVAADDAKVLKQKFFSMVLKPLVADCKATFIGAKSARDKLLSAAGGKAAYDEFVAENSDKIVGSPNHPEAFVNPVYHYPISFEKYCIENDTHYSDFRSIVKGRRDECHVGRRVFEGRVDSAMYQLMARKAKLRAENRDKRLNIVETVQRTRSSSIRVHCSTCDYEGWSRGTVLSSLATEDMKKTPYFQVTEVLSVKNGKPDKLLFEFDKNADAKAHLRSHTDKARATPGGILLPAVTKSNSRGIAHRNLETFFKNHPWRKNDLWVRKRELPERMFVLERCPNNEAHKYWKEEENRYKVDKNPPLAPVDKSKAWMTVRLNALKSRKQRSEKKNRDAVDDRSDENDDAEDEI